jgi:hypothetical protein
MVGIVEAGETVGDDLSGGSGCGLGGFGGLLSRKLFRSGLSVCGERCRGEVLLRRNRQSGLRAGDDKNLFELIEVGGGTKFDEGIWLVVEVWIDGLNSADR